MNSSAEELLEASFQAVILQGEAFVAAFYERLFARFPQTRTFFAETSMSDQRKKLQQSLALIVANMRSPETVAPTFRELGLRHISYGIRPEHYPPVGAVLLETFADFLGSQWTQAHHDAWSEAYTAVSKIMLQGPGGG